MRRRSKTLRVGKHAAQEWPQVCLAAAGQFAGFPLAGDASATLAADVPRVGF
jgi:hypothetical protein